MIKLLIISEIESIENDIANWQSYYKQQGESWYDWVKQLPGFIKFDSSAGTRRGINVDTNTNITVCEVYFNDNNSVNNFLQHSNNIKAMETAKKFAKWIKIIKVKIDE